MGTGTGQSSKMPEFCDGWPEPVPIFSRSDLFQGSPGLFLLAYLGAAALFAWFLVVLASAKLFLHSTAFDQLLETAERHSNRLLVVYPHT